MESVGQKKHPTEQDNHSCDWQHCTRPVRWLGWASFKVGDDVVRPKYETYPAPMMRSCNEHLTAMLNVHLHSGLHPPTHILIEKVKHDDSVLDSRDHRA